MPGPRADYRADVAAAVRAGELSGGALDAAVRRILELHAKHAAAEGTPVARSLDERLDVARAVAEGSAVLLENDGALPLDAGRARGGDRGLRARAALSGCGVVEDKPSVARLRLGRARGSRRGGLLRARATMPPRGRRTARCWTRQRAMRPRPTWPWFSSGCRTPRSPRAPIAPTWRCPPATTRSWSACASRIRTRWWCCRAALPWSFPGAGAARRPAVLPGRLPGRAGRGRPAAGARESLGQAGRDMAGALGGHAVRGALPREGPPGALPRERLHGLPLLRRCGRGRGLSVRPWAVVHGVLLPRPAGGRGARRGLFRVVPRAQRRPLRRQGGRAAVCGPARAGSVPAAAGAQGLREGGACAGRGMSRDASAAEARLRALRCGYACLGCGSRRLRGAHCRLEPRRAPERAGGGGGLAAP